MRQGKAVGKITSGTFAPTVGKAIAMAYLRPAHAAAGTECEVDVRGKAPEYPRIKALVRWN